MEKNWHQFKEQITITPSEKIWQRLKKNISNQPSTLDVAYKRTIKSKNIFALVASIAILTIGLGWILFQNSKNTHHWIVEENMTSIPKVIELEDGSVFG